MNPQQSNESLLFDATNTLDSNVKHNLQTHVLRVRLNVVDLNLACSRLSDAVSLLLAQWPVPSNSVCNRFQLFCQKMEFNATDEKAITAINKECHRPLNITFGSQLRVVCFTYEDGMSDLFVTADAKCCDKAMMEYLARVFAHPNPTELGAKLSNRVPIDLPASYYEAVNTAEFVFEQQLNDIGFDSGMGCYESRVNAATHSCIVAGVAKVLSVLGNTEQPGLAVLPTQPNLTDGNGYCLLPLQLKDANLNDLTAEIDKQLAQLPVCGESLGKLFQQQIKRKPQVSVGVVLLETDDSDPSFVEYQYLPFCQAHLPLTIVVESKASDDATVRLTYHFDHSLFCAASVEQFDSCLQHVMSEFIKQHDKSLEMINVLSPSAQQEIVDLGVTATTKPQRLARIDDGVDEMAKANADAIALSYGEEELTYSELQQLSNQLSRVLIDNGVNRGDHIGICVDRGVNLIVAMLAVMKAGAVYVPVDPNYPAERIQYICDDASLTILLTLTTQEIEVQGCKLVELSEYLALAENMDVARPLVENICPEDAAYIIYTSGSTGKPKGVVIPHKNVNYLIDGLRNSVGLNDKDVWTMFHSYAFDFSIWEIWGALLTGGEVVVVSYEVSRDTSAFIGLINQRKVTIMSQTPSAFYQFISFESTLPVGRSLRAIVFGGEALDASMLLPWFNRHPESECRLINMYGITETTVHVTEKDVTRFYAVNGSRSVGTPIAGWSVRVLDDKQQVLPLGVAGEIYVGGEAMASRYHNRPDLTAQRFIKDPLGSGLLYRSGDKGALLENGELLHLGRLDNQIKLRGFRIELDEIRNTMLALDGVEAATVVFSQTDKSDPATARLDGYVVLNGANLGQLQTHVSQKLPAFMVPSSISTVANFPLTANGKLDTTQIKDNVLETTFCVGVSDIEAEPTESSTVTQNDSATENQNSDRHQMMIDIWSEVFNKPVKVDSNFFDLGGNSLFAIRIGAKMKEMGLAELHLREFYIHQDIESLLNAVNI